MTLAFTITTFSGCDPVVGVFIPNVLFVYNNGFWNFHGGGLNDFFRVEFMLQEFVYDFECAGHTLITLDARAVEIGHGPDFRVAVAVHPGFCPGVLTRVRATDNGDVEV